MIKKRKRKPVVNNQKILMNFRMMKRLVPLYRELLGDPKQLKIFFGQFRNSIFDTTQSKEFKSGFISFRARQAKLTSNVKLVEDHVVRRIHGVEYLFQLLNEDSRITYRTFKKHLKLVGQKVLLTSEEHKLVNEVTKGNNTPNFEVYKSLNFDIVGTNFRGRTKNWDKFVYTNLLPVYQKLGLFVK